EDGIILRVFRIQSDGVQFADLGEAQRGRLECRRMIVRASLPRYYESGIRRAERIHVSVLVSEDAVVIFDVVFDVRIEESRIGAVGPPDFGEAAVRSERAAVHYRVISRLGPSKLNFVALRPGMKIGNDGIIDI